MPKSSDSDSHPALLAVTGADHSGWLIIASCVFLIFSFVALVAKLVISRSRSSAPGHYDIALVAALILALAETICVIFACKHGVGKFRNAVDDASFELAYKFSYAASILWIVSQAASKLSVGLFVIALSPYALILNLCRCTLAIIAAWTISGSIAFAVQCRFPTPWISAVGACFDQRAFSLYLGTINIVTDVALILIPTYLMFLTQSAARYQVIALFVVRIIVPIIAIFFMLSLGPLFSSKSTDPTRDIVVPEIWGQIVLNLSIITACIPGLKRIIDAYRSDAAAVSIAPPYEVAVSTNRWSKWFEGSAFSFKSWKGRRSPPDTGRDTGQQDSDLPAFELQSTRANLRRRGSEKDGGRIRYLLPRRVDTAAPEPSLSTTCLTTSAITSNDHGSRATTNHESCNTSLSPESEIV